MQITWLGHSTIYLKTNAGTRILIDAWIENNPACPPEWHAKLRELGVDIIMLTHGHTDHCVDTAALYNDTHAQVVCQYDAVEWLTYQNVANESIVALNKGGTARINDVRITMVNAQHSNSWPTSVGPRMFGSEVGYVLRVDNDITVYAAGDTNVMPDMAIIADLYHPDVAMIPIGDVYTMGPYEAAYAMQLLKSAAVLPIHHSTFPGLPGTPAQFSAELALRGVVCDVLNLAPGQTIAQGTK